MVLILVVAVICLSGYAVLASSARNFLGKSRASAWIERGLGILLVFFGTSLALE